MPPAPSPQESILQHRLHSVTPLSKYLARALFILLPFVGGYIGYVYAPEKVVEVEKVIYTYKNEQTHAINTTIGIPFTSLSEEVVYGNFLLVARDVDDSGLETAQFIGTTTVKVYIGRYSDGSYTLSTVAAAEKVSGIPIILGVNFLEGAIGSSLQLTNVSDDWFLQQMSSMGSESFYGGFEVSEPFEITISGLVITDPRTAPSNHIKTTLVQL